MMRTSRILLTALSSILVGCSPPQVENPLSTPIVDSDLVGSWKLKYDGKTIFDKASGVSVYGKGTEKITLMPDGRYMQEFDDYVGGAYPETESIWKLAKNFSGRQVVVLDGLRNYKNGVATAIDSQPPQSTSLLIEVASSVPFGEVKELILCFDEVDAHFCFSRSTIKSED